MIAAELRPPRAELATAASMDAWIDTYHAVRGLTQGRHVRLPDRQRRRHEGRRQPAASRHQSRQRRPALARRPVPDLQAHDRNTACAYADRARHNGFESLVILGGDKHVGPAAVRRARVAAARDDPRARGGAGARRMGQSACRTPRRRCSTCSTIASRRSSTSRRSCRTTAGPPSSGSSRKASAAA